MRRAEVRAALLSSARDLGRRGRDAEYGAGLVQAVARARRRRSGHRGAGRATTLDARRRAGEPAAWPAIALAVAGVAVRDRARARDPPSARPR